MNLSESLYKNTAIYLLKSSQRKYFYKPFVFFVGLREVFILIKIVFIITLARNPTSLES